MTDMGPKGITVNTAPGAEAHVYAEDDAAIFQSMFGSDGVLEVGQECESQVISNNKVRIKDGVIIVGGHIARIPYGEYVDCEIANGQSGKKRNDIIVGKFTTTGSGGIDTMTCEVKQGAAVTGTAEDPELTQNDIYQGGKIREMPLYRIKLDGLSITGVEPMFDLIPSIPTLNASLAELSDDIDKKEPTQKRGGSGCYRKSGYECILQAADVPAKDIVKALDAAYRPVGKPATVTGWCKNNNTEGYYPCLGRINTDGKFQYLSALNELGQTTPYYIYSEALGENVLSRFNVWLSGAWMTNVNGT